LEHQSKWIAMPKLYLVRHGRAAAGFGEDADPGLDPLGQSQAAAAAERLNLLPRMALRSSPLRRARETAAPLEALWKQRAHIDPAVSEIPSPTPDLAARVVWLRDFMQGRWTDVEPAVRAWRSTLIRALLGLEEDCIIFSHYVAINVAAGAALQDDRTLVFSPANASITIFEHDGQTLRLIEKGQEAPLTRVN
jgi:broad specificity phosphatase PhoE